MSLGVLNNLSAVYAENNLNNTNNSLNTVLQQLSSGSKINSGADDAAGLSLVDGLQANQQALTQSQTNATEGVGLSAGRRWRPLASHKPAQPRRNAGYRSLQRHPQQLAGYGCQPGIPVDPVGNLQHRLHDHLQPGAVFNSNTNIYTGDSSTTGASIDALNIRSLCPRPTWATPAASMAYSNGASNVFIDLSTASGTWLRSPTQLNSDRRRHQAEHQLTWRAGASGVVAQTTATIAVGGTTPTRIRPRALMTAINGSGLGVTATSPRRQVGGQHSRQRYRHKDRWRHRRGYRYRNLRAGCGVGAGATPGEIGYLDGNGGGGADGDTFTAGSIDVKEANGTSGQHRHASLARDLATLQTALGQG